MVLAGAGGAKMASVTCLAPHGDGLTIPGLVQMVGPLSSHGVGSDIV